MFIVHPRIYRVDHCLEKMLFVKMVTTLPPIDLKIIFFLINFYLHVNDLNVKTDFRPEGNNVRLFVLFGAYRPTREFFTHMETSLLPVKGCKI